MESNDKQDKAITEHEGYAPFKISDLNINGIAAVYYNSGSFRFNLPAVFHRLLGITFRKSGKYCAIWHFFQEKENCLNLVEKLYREKTIFFLVIPKEKFEKLVH